MAELAFNREALRNYDILERIEAGIVLTGTEVKSAKGGHITLRGSYARIVGKSGKLVNAHISPYDKAGATQRGYNPTRTRTLLLRGHEAGSLAGKTAHGGLTLIPIRLYTRGGFVKVELGLAKGRTRHDKRAILKKREVDRKIRRALRQKE